MIREGIPYEMGVHVKNNGANTQTRGYAYKLINWWPDSVVASTNWLNPGQEETRSFPQTKDDKYYGQIVGQTVGSRGYVTITVK